jgi:hypothetical protein
MDRVTFAIAHEQIESFMGGVNLTAPRSGIKGLNNVALPAPKRWMAYPYIAVR